MNLLASLRYLVALSEHGHYARAAQSCHITQPALSNALRALEKEFGTPIVRRGRTYAGLTPEGERVLATAHRLLREHELLLQELHSTAERPQGVLNLGVVPTAVPVAARFAAMLQARYPGISPIVRSMSSQEIESGLENLSLDMGLGFMERRALQASCFNTLAQYTEHYFLVRRAAPSAAERGLVIGNPLGWREAGALPLCLLTPEMHNRTIVDAAFSEAGVAVKPVMETNSILTLVVSVLAGDLCSVLPGALVGAVRSEGALEALPLVQPEVRTPVGFVTWAGAPPSRALQAALVLAAEPGWVRDAGEHSGTLAFRN